MRLSGLVKREQATGEIGMGVALEFERHRFGAAFHPDFAAHDSLDAIVNLAAHHAVMNSKGHELMLAEMKPPSTSGRTVKSEKFPLIL